MALAAAKAAEFAWWTAEADAKVAGFEMGVEGGYCGSCGCQCPAVGGGYACGGDSGGHTCPTYRECAELSPYPLALAIPPYCR